MRTNKTIEALSIELERAEKRIGFKDGWVAKIGELKSELKSIDDVIKSLATLRPSLEKVLKPNRDATGLATEDRTQYSQQLSVQLSHKRFEIDDEIQESMKTIAACDAAKNEVENIRLAITERKEQEKRFAGILGMNRPFGERKINIEREADFILKMLALRVGGLTSVKRDELQKLRYERENQAIKDIVRWAQENEVVKYAFRPFNYSLGIKTYSTSVLCRVIEHRAKHNGLTERDINTERLIFVADKLANMLFVPFDQYTVSEWALRATKINESADANLRPIDLIISPDGSVAFDTRVVQHNREDTAVEFVRIGTTV